MHAHLDVCVRDGHPVRHERVRGGACGGSRTTWHVRRYVRQARYGYKVWRAQTTEGPRQPLSSGNPRVGIQAMWTGGLPGTG